MAQPAAQGFGVQLLPQGVQTLAREHVAALHNDRPTAGRRPAVIEAKDGAGIDPVQAFGFLAAPAQRGGLAQGVALSDPEDAPEEMKRQLIADIATAVYEKLHELGETRPFHDRVKEWSVACSSHSGTGSARKRALGIEGIYGGAAHIPGEAADAYASALVSAVKTAVKEAVEAAGGRVDA